MKTKEKVFLRLLLIIFAFLIVLPLSTAANTEGTADVSTADEFKNAVQNSVANINLTADIDLTGAGVLDVSGMTINLNGNKILANNFSLIFEGTDFTIKNGTFDAKGGAYALFIGDMGETDNVTIEDVILIGGINVFNSTNVVLKNIEATGGPNYYAIWCDENGHVIVKSGNFKSTGAAVIGLATCDEPEGNATLDIEGGKYITNGTPLVLLGNYGIPKIKGGTFDIPVLPEYCAEGYEPVTLGGENYSVCNHSNTVIKEAVAPTCVNEGYSGDIYCAKCDKLIENGETIQALGHNYSDWKGDEENHWKECTNEGCNEIMPDTLGAHSNTIKKGEVEPTCVTDGYSGDTYCEICGKLVEKGKTIQALGHNYSDWKYDKDNHWKECTNEDCNEVIPDTLGAHKFNAEGKCEVCSYENPDKKPENPEIPDKPENPGENEDDKPVNFLEDSKTQIKLDFKDNVLEENTILEVLAISEGTTYENVGKKLSDAKEFVIYDINLFKNGVKVQPNGKVLLSLPIPENFDKTRLAIYRIDEDNKIEYTGKITTIDNMDYIQFETDHFSYYVLAEKQEDNNKDETPKEDDKTDINKEPEEEKEPEHKLDDEPKTGMADVALIASSILSISIIGYTICKKKSVKN